MQATSIIEELRRFGEVEELHDGAIRLKTRPHLLPEIARLLHWRDRSHYSTTVGSDERFVDGAFHVYHIFTLDKERLFVVVEVKVSPGTLTIPSITPAVPGANWAEREAMDMLGIRFSGHPEPKRLILPHNWPEGVYPLRKDFPYNRKIVVEAASEEPEHDPELSKKYTIIPVGPYHPALHEPEYFELYVEGERVVEARYKGFMVHRGIEKVAEARLTINQIPFIAERICGICGFTHSCCYCQAVENAARIDVPERALYIRSIMLEIERIHSHLLWFGILFHVLGFDTGFMIMWRIREKVMDVAEMLTGNRKMYGLNLVGGVRRDIREEHIGKVIKTLEWVEREFRDYINRILGLKEIIRRTRGIGVLDRETAKKISVVGPTARGSGIDTDARKYHPYAAYKYVDFKIPVYDEGDVYARALVRRDEVFESINIIRQLLKDMPKTPLIVEEFSIPEHRLGVSATEAPRGENVHLVITGRDNKVYRWRPRAPSYNNIPATLEMLRGQPLADAPAIIASIDPCFSCTDHVIIIDLKSGVRRRVSMRELSRGVM